MADQITENMSQRWWTLFHRPVVADSTVASVDVRIKAAFEAKAPALDEAGTKKALRTEQISREGRITAMNLRHEAARRSRDWAASS